MNGYHYEAKADSLRSRGIDVKEFGSRTLREGCFGEDVLSLQNWLTEENLYTPTAGGHTGYFGPVTKEALQLWQRHHGLEATGTFDATTKWAYLRGLELRTEAAAPLATHSVAAPTANARSDGAVTVAPLQQVMVIAAVITGVVLAKASAPRLITKALSLWHRKSGAAAMPTAAHDSDMDGADMALESAASAQHADQVIAEAVPPTPGPRRTSTLRRLSEDEIQRYIAPMKGPAANRTPLQRPAPRPLKSYISRPERTAAGEDAKSGAPPSKHGTYFGGRRVLEEVKQHLTKENGGAAGAGAQRMGLSSTGYDMRRGARGARAPQPAPQQAQQLAPRIVSPLQVPTPAGFQDLPGMPPAEQAEQAEQAQQAVALLLGTDLEDEPERPVRAVPVQKPAKRNPLGGVAVAEVEARVPVQTATAGAPRPVAVVKPNRGGNVEAGPASASPPAPVDPSATVVMSNKPIKLHKPARLAGRSIDSDA